ncbi:MAG: response regulator, partial [Bdellovibrionota bacterium]
NLISRFLIRKGFEVMTAENGQEAIDLLSSGQVVPHLILLDLMMPIMDGFQFAQEVKALDKAGLIPIIAMSADAHALREQRHRLNVQGYIKKPIDIRALVEAIDQILAA